MGFEDLEQKLHKFLTKEAQSVDLIQKIQIKEQALAEYSAKKNGFWTTLWINFSSYKYSKLATSAVAIALLVGILPVLNNQLYAGEISSKNGLVEIMRNGKKMIITDKAKLKVGDEIIVSNNANAQINLRNNFQSEVFENSKLKLTGRSKIFLSEGQMGNALQKGTISTVRGEISAKSPSNFLIDVSSSGETKIMPQKNSVFVKNWEGTEIELTAGEELRLRTDTVLSNQELPRDINLSLTQIKAVRAKLFIARTKALNYFENSKNSRDLEPATKTFKSIVQILKTSRNLQPLMPRENINMINIEAVYEKLSKKTKDVKLLNEVKAVEVLIKTAQNTRNLNFDIPQTDVLSFNRYVIVSRLFAQKNSPEKELGDILRNQYVNSFAQNIFNEELRIDQISVLNGEVKKLPLTTMAKYFLAQVKTQLTPELQELLEEKIEDRF